MKFKGAQILVKTLIEQGVDTIFGYPGGSVLDIYDALTEYKNEIRNILTSTEQGAAHAADGYARSTGKTGVALATSGPGATNLVTGIATAFMDSIPVVYITGSVARNLIGKDSFQEIFITGVTMPITKHNFVVRDIKKLSSTIREAFKIANTGRKGPVLVDVPKDIMQELYEYDECDRITVSNKEFNNINTIKEIAKIINNSQKPVIYCGGGVVSSNAYIELRKFINKSCIPACNSILGIGVLEHNEYYLGMAGMHGRVSTNYAIDNADLVIAIGARFSDRTVTKASAYAPNAKIIHIDIDASEIRKNVRVDYDLVGDVGDILTKLIPFIEENTDRYLWMKEIQQWKKLDYIAEESNTKIKPYSAIKEIENLIEQDSIVVTDVGQHQMWASQYLIRTIPRTFLTSAGLGTMGYGYGAAIGAKIANPDKVVIHITGDGSFHMNLNECPTATHYGVKIITIVMNNSSLGMVRQWQHHLYNDVCESSDFFRDTDYVKLAEAFGAQGYLCNTIDELKTSLKKALKSEKSAIINCIISRDEQVLPMIPSGGTLDNLIMK